MFSLGLRELMLVTSGVTAAAGTAYVTGVLDPFLGRTPPAVVAALPETPPAPKEQPPVTNDAVPQPEQPQVVDAPQPVVPSFDLVRLEADGSLVVAGKAAPNANVEILADEAVIATTTASADGDFVAVLDNPLKPGDYQITLRATTPDNVVAVSVAAAVVSVPEKPDGQVLVLLDEPGAPAQLMTVPEAPAEEEVAEAPPPENVTQEEAAPAEEEVAEAPAEEEVAEAPAEEEVAEAPAEEVVGEAPAETEIAAAPEEDAHEPAKPQPAVEHRVGVEAVEIEGGTVFVAGYADPMRFVRVYANEVALGEARASEVGRFLVEARRELPVGAYLIRADLLDDNGEVIARAAVPFEREPGESIAAVAPSAPEAEPEVVEEEVAVAPEAEPEIVEDEVVAAPEAEPEVVEEEVVAAPEAKPEVAEEEVAVEPEPEMAEEEVAAAPDVQPEPEPEVAEAPAEVAAPEVDATAPALQRVDGAVIIRRGDSLWRISRRVYGMGVRYSTIYLANQEQITDPHRIWPGQVFAVPRETPEGDTADMQAISEQAVGPEGAETVAQ